MSGQSKIEWTDATWNPVVGCSVVSPGCTNCYAMRLAARLLDKPGSHYHGTTKRVKGNAVWTGNIAMAPEETLIAPVHWKKPRRIFVNSMGDLFHESVPDEWIDKVFAVMAMAPQHTFQVLTKRAKRMREYTNTADRPLLVMNEIFRRIGPPPIPLKREDINQVKFLHNVWLGVSAEDQARADERIPDLLATPAAVRFVSCEPLLGPIDLEDIKMFGGMARYDGLRYGEVSYCGKTHRCRGLDWVIAGGESGAGARAMQYDWAASLLRQCQLAQVPFFFKQWGEWAPVYAHPDYTKIVMHRLGKVRAGRTLDGYEWNEFPVQKESA
jgi:protein gp37